MNTLLYTSVADDGHLKVPRLTVGHIFAGVVLSTLVYLTALQWNNALTLSIQNLQNKHQELNEEEASYLVASSITVFIVLITLIIYFALRSQSKQKPTSSSTIESVGSGVTQTSM
jgi:lysylphosphatidylglycerol synthetase-like protein (DUF2156 family)